MDKKKIDIDVDCPVCSAGDCTGLIPAGLDSESELEAYNEMYNFIPDPVTKKETETKNHTGN